MDKRAKLNLRSIKSICYLKSSRGGLEVERLLHTLHDSTSVGSNLARHQKDFRSYSNTTGGALVYNDV